MIDGPTDNLTRFLGFGVILLQLQGFHGHMTSDYSEIPGTHEGDKDDHGLLLWMKGLK